MRNKIIKFLSELPADLSAQFNGALQLFIQTPGHNPSMARYYNSAGFNAQRLSELLYDLKKAHDILPSDILVKPAKVVKLPTKPKDSNPSGFPEFSKGTKGNLERREYVEKLGLTAKSNKNVDLDAVILEYLKTTPVVTASVVASDKSLDELVRELAGIKFRKETPSLEFLKEIKVVANLSEVEFEKFLFAVESSSERIGGLFEKLDKLQGADGADSDPEDKGSNVPVLDKESFLKVFNEIKVASDQSMNDGADLGLPSEKEKALYSVMNLLEDGADVSAELIREIYKDESITDGEAFGIVSYAKSKLQLEKGSGSDSGETNPGSNEDTSNEDTSKKK